jgi:pimeloyl-ACP methyl ester carboxylesterase|tara:strand:+ start:6679 stop:7662 length:984 start_codon:yes stop_codon:yes gene_type:complete
MTPNEFTLQQVQANGISQRCALAGPPSGPLVLLVHGWPESWYSWRHQIACLAQAGWRVAAPDMRGYGGSDKPAAVQAYDMASMTGDLAGLITALGHRDAVLVGHDWGAPVVWNTAILHPDKVRAVVGLSVPHMARPKLPQTQLFKALYQDRFFYMLYFQEPGKAEAELEQDLDVSLRKIYWALSGQAEPGSFTRDKDKRANLLDGLPLPASLAPLMGAEDLAYYRAQFAASGFRGPLNRYRNFERDWRDLPQLHQAPVTQPSLFITGDRDPVLTSVPGRDLRDVAPLLCPQLRALLVLDGVGHWTQQEAPDAVNRALLAFLREFYRP